MALGAPATFAESVGAVANKVFLARNPRRTWAGSHAIFQILATEDLTTKRMELMEQITPVSSTVGKAEAYKWPVSMYAPTGASSFARGAAYTFPQEDRYVFGQVTPKNYQQPASVPTTDLDVHMSASGNENAVGILVNTLNDAKYQLLQFLRW